MSDYSQSERLLLLQTALSSIRYGLQHGKPMPVDLTTTPESLRQHRASFVTLQRHHQLRGCIGSLLPERPLIEDVSSNAYAAAFSDPRFPALEDIELPELDLELSVLSLPELIYVNNERELLDQLRPGIDGLIIKDGLRRATFLPTVWGQLSKPEEFLSHLKRKAGLAADYWSDTMEIERYTTESFGMPVSETE
ncbi:MAG: AmmeMemoRadiSam system protein A [Gammaproteobacteria bacterium]|nr:AmmeMemoRadiSam system protein A [Gammaproteobacteria bacterium]